MTKISLRAYYREIEKLIDTGQTDEAIAHCRHILQTYPKHVGTYRLLGKAFLETQRYGDAADILQRVLSANPEDFISHLGMSIVREDEGNLDEAIWHMERAFEIQPANAAIQDELKRLYGRRDGLEPHKIHLTRGALARMYARGSLYQQAIAEIRAALAEDPQRPDLQTVLSRMYALSGQRAEAADTCQALLSKFPNCMEATRIMADILAETGRADEAKPYRQRLQALEPYAAFLSAGLVSVDQVPENAVQLDRLDWSPDQPSGVSSSQPEWASSLGVKIDEFSSRDEALPQWLNPTEEPEPSSGQPAPALEHDALPSWVRDEPKPDSKPQAVEDELPDWMKSAGWVPSSGEVQDEANVFTPEEPASEPTLPDQSLAQADIPDWLRAIAPADSGDEAQAAQALSSQTIWQDLEASTEEAPQPAEGLRSDLPDWLAELGQLATEPAPSEMTPPAAESVAAGEASLPAQNQPDELPDWLNDLASPSAPVEPVVSETSFPQEALEVDDEAVSADVAPVFPSSESEAPAIWQYEEPEPAEPLATEAAVILDTPPQVPGQGMLNWLSGNDQSGVKPAAEVEEPAPAMVAPQEGAPAFLPLAAEEAATTAEPPVEGEKTESVGQDWPDAEKYVPEWMSVVSHAAPGEAKPDLPGEAEAFDAQQLPDWLAEALGGAEAATGLAGAEAFEAPDWLAEAEQQESTAAGEGVAPVEPAVAQPEAALPEPALPAAEEMVGSPTSQEEDSFAWLESLAARQGALEDELLTQPGARPSEVPAWLQDLKAESGEPPTAEAAPELEPIAPADLSAAELPDWLSLSQPAEEPVIVETDQPAPAVLPDWLLGMAKEGAAEPAELIPPTEVPAADLEQPVETVPVIDTQPVRIHRAAAEISSEAAQGALPVEPEPPTLVGPVQVPKEEPLTLSLDDEAAAMAWLESLAARQGALEEELLTRPEDRLEQPPTWIQEMAATEAATAAAQETEASAAEGDFSPVAETQVPEVGSDRAELGEILAEPEEEAVAAPIEPLLAEASAEAEEFEIPEWLRGIDEAKGELAEVEGPAVMFGTPEPDRYEGLGAEEISIKAVEAEVQPPGPAEIAEPSFAAADEGFSPLSPADENAALAWLESLAARQGAQEDEMLTQPEDRPEQAPEWVQRAAGPEAMDLLTGTATAYEFSETTSASAEPPAESTGQPTAAEQAPAGVPAASLQTLEGEVEIVIETEAEPAATAEAAPYHAEAAQPELPDWLSNLTQPEQFDEETWSPPEQVEPGQNQPVWAAADVSDDQRAGPQVGKIDLNIASLAQLERLPGIGFILAQKIVTYRDTFGVFKSFDDLRRIPGVDQATLVELQQWVSLASLPPVSPVTTTMETRPVTPELSQARNALESGKLAESLTIYENYIKEERHLPEIILDLRQAMTSHPREVAIYQSLGDAYVRNNQLQEALEIYLQAEDILR